MKKKILAAVGILAAAAAVIAIVVFVVNKWTLTLMIEQEEPYIQEYNTEISLPEAKAVWAGTIFQKEGKEVPYTTEHNIDVMTMGTYSVTYKAEYKGQTAEQTIQVEVADRQGPVIELVHKDGYYTLPGQPYEEEGYTAVDNYDGDVTAKVISYEKDGVVYYEAEDSFGNKGTAERKIFYDDPIPPELTLEGDMNITLSLGDNFEEPGFKASDNVDGDITDRVKVQGLPDNNMTVGEYPITYTAEDGYGNQTVQTRVLKYVNPVPKITLEGGEKTYVTIGAEYSEPGYAAESNIDGNLTAQVQVNGEVNTAEAGEYPILYTVTNSFGETAQVTRTVVVRRKTTDQSGNEPDGKRIIYLTFDDGPCAYTAELLDTLAQYDAKATFFVTNQFPDYAYMLKNIYEQGHAVAAHSYSHDYATVYASSDAFWRDFDKINDLIEQYTGRRSNLLRFPGGSSNTVSRKYCKGLMTELAQEAADRGVAYFDWNVDSEDASGRKLSPETLAQNVIDGCSGRKVSVVLQHDIHYNSVKAVKKILEWGNSHGYEFRALDVDSYGAHHGINN